jgi:benzoyl-CoA reductase/2-hydroxyglutaryl-CoA dehydratase subunit BcrC/BadD/HgdB
MNNINIFFSNSIKTGKTTEQSVGWVCSYTPEELILAGGFLPLRILGEQKPVKAESYFPTNFCPFIKSIWEDILNNQNKLKAIIFTNSCDGMRRLYDICNTYNSKIPSFLLDVPRIKNQVALDHFTYNLSKMVKFIETLKKDKSRNSKISNSDIKNTVKLINKKRELLKELTLYYKNTQNLINAQTYYKIMEISMTSDPYIFVEDLKKYINMINESRINNDVIEIPPDIMIIGNFINEEALWKIVSELNFKIAADDLCNSSRYYEKKVEINDISNKDIIKSIAYRYLNKPQCMRMANLGLKLEEINKSISENKIKGVIFISQKFCDNTLLFYPILKQNLSEINISSLFIEIEHNNFSTGQIKTRIQAFLEMIP